MLSTKKFSAWASVNPGPRSELSPNCSWALAFPSRKLYPLYTSSLSKLISWVSHGKLKHWASGSDICFLCVAHMSETLGHINPERIDKVKSLHVQNWSLDSGGESPPSYNSPTNSMASNGSTTLKKTCHLRWIVIN